MKKLIALVLAVVCVLGLVGCNNKTVNIDLPFEVGDVENIEMYHFVGAPVSAEKKVIVAEETIVGGTPSAGFLACVHSLLECMAGRE